MVVNGEATVVSDKNEAGLPLFDINIYVLCKDTTYLPSIVFQSYNRILVTPLIR